MDLEQIKVLSFSNLNHSLRFNEQLTLTAYGSGGCKAADKNSPVLPTSQLIICKHREFKGVLKSWVVDIQKKHHKHIEGKAT